MLRDDMHNFMKVSQYPPSYVRAVAYFLICLLDILSALLAMLLLYLMSEEPCILPQNAILFEPDLG